VATPVWEKRQATGLALRQTWTPDAEPLYADALSAVERTALRSATRAISPDAVVRAVTHALTAPPPKTRYLVGTAARIQAISPSSPTGCATASSRVLFASPRPARSADRLHASTPGR
jgi:hypothetical protein